MGYFTTKKCRAANRSSSRISTAPVESRVKSQDDFFRSNYLGNHLLTWVAAGEVIAASILAFAFPMLLEAISDKSMPRRFVFAWVTLSMLAIALLVPA
jgi:hypothetical protein